MITYTLQEYADQILHCHVNTVKNRIHAELLPFNHKVKKGKKQWMITIEPVDGKCLQCEKYFNAALEFNARKKGKVGNLDYNAELAAELCIKFDLGATKFFKMMGL